MRYGELWWVGDGLLAARFELPLERAIVHVIDQVVRPRANLDVLGC